MQWPITSRMALRCASGGGSSSPVRAAASRLAIRCAAAIRKCPLPQAGSTTLSLRIAASGSGCFAASSRTGSRGLTISATTSFSHDFWTNVIHNGVERKAGEEVMVARISAFAVGGIAITIAIVLGPTANVAFLVALAFAVAASANLPVIVLSIFWRRFNTLGAVSGLTVGLLASIGLILISPSLMVIDPPTVTGTARHLIQAKAWFPLENPGILSIPLGFIGAILGTLVSHEPSSQDKFNELLVRSNTGLGAEKATAH